MNRFFLLFLAVIGCSILFSEMRSVIGVDIYMNISAAVLVFGIWYLLKGAPMDEPSFWIIITLVGKNFEGLWFAIFYAIALVYIVFATGLITFQRK